MIAVSQAAMSVPIDPDWVWLRSFLGYSSILHEGVSLDYIAEREAGRIACVATPGSEAGCGPVLAADQAMEWVLACAEAGLITYSPTIVAGLARVPSPCLEPAVRAAEYVIVPPSDIWATSNDIWTCVTLALAAVKPVYVLEGCV